MWHLLAGASYLGSSTYNGSLLPAIAATCVPLDPIGPATAGRIRIEAMFRRAHDMGLVFAEKGIAVIQDEKTFSTLIIAERPKQVRTSKKWNAHLEELEAWSIITKIKKSEAEGMASYFAVFKTTTSARAIFNGKRLSTCFAPPPPVNLPRLSDVFNGLREKYFFTIADVRHFFHQIRLQPNIRRGFCVASGRRVWCWRTLPMGWSYSPHVAQCVAWTILFEACLRSGMISEEDYRSYQATPRFLENGAKDWWMTIYYDNLLAAFITSEQRELFLKHLHEVCVLWNVEWKDQGPTRHNITEMNCNTTFEGKKFTYLGIQFGRGKHSHDGSEVLMRRHDPMKLAIWTQHLDGICTTSSPREIARLIGCAVWDSMIRLTPLCTMQKEMDFFRVVSHQARLTNWDAVGCWSKCMLDCLTTRYRKMLLNPWQSVEDSREERPQVWGASDACDFGLGGVMWIGKRIDESFTISERVPASIVSSHIFVKEMYAAMRVIRKMLLNRRGIHICLAIDNTAVVHAIHNRYRSNDNANEMLLRMHNLLVSKNSSITAVPVISVDNAADAPSRGNVPSELVDQRCYQVISAFLAGALVSFGERTAGPASSGSFGHEEPQHPWYENILDGVEPSQEDIIDEVQDEESQNEAELSEVRL